MYTSDSDETYPSSSEEEVPHDGDVETVKILGQTLNLPCKLLEDKDVFMEMFSWENIKSLPSDDLSKLREFLPKELQNDPAESEKTLEMLFSNQLTRFDQTTLDTFFNNLQDGNYRPDIARYRKKILEAEKKEHMIKECDYLSTLVENVISSREKLLKEAYGMNSVPKMLQTTSESISENMEYLTPATFKAKERYNSELAGVFDKLNLPQFDKELLSDRKKSLNVQSKPSTSDLSLKINGTMSMRNKVTKNIKVGKERYKQMLKSFRKRKSIEPDHPELEISDLKLNDIAARVKLTSRVKKIVVKSRDISETEEESAKFKIIKKEVTGEVKKRKYNQVNRKRRIVEAKGADQKRRNVMDSKAIRIGTDSLENTINYPSSEASEELNLKNVRYACFFSLVRDIFCSTADHRMKLEEFRQEIKAWSESTTAALNNWFKNVEDWNVLLFSSVQFLSGEFKNLPSDFVPFLEFKTQLNMYQWIGAGRDSDARMSSLCDFWMQHRNEGGVKKNQMKFKVFDKTTKNPEINQENHLRQVLSPPSAKCRSEWKVCPATKESIREFSLLEKQRFERPQMPFTYHHHGYFSVVGPIDIARMNITPIQKMKDNSFLIPERPHYITLQNLVRDAAARMPNGEGTRSDISKLLKYSHYLLPNLSDSVVETIVSEILDKVHKEEDCYLKYDTKKSLWIYIHRNRSEKDFENIEKMKKSQAIPTTTYTIATPTTSFKASEADDHKIVGQQHIVKIPAKKVFKISKMTESGGFDVEESLPAGTIQLNKKIQRVVPKKINQIISTNQKFEFKIANPPTTTTTTQEKVDGKTIIRATPIMDANDQPKPNMIKIHEPSGIIKPQQKIILTTASLQKQGKIMTIMKNDSSMVPMLSHQKQILTNVIVQQQKAKTPNQVILTNVNQKMPSITISSKNIRPTSLVQIPQTSTSATATTNIIPQQRQINVQTIKSNAIDKPPTTITANVISTAVKGKPIKTDVTTPTIKQGPGGVFQISPQFTMMTKGKVIQLPNNSQIITSSSDATSSSRGELIFADSTTSPNNQLKIIQSGSIPQQQIVGAKFLNVTGLTGRAVRTAGGVKVITPQNYQLTKFAGKPLIIAKKTTTPVNNQSGLVLQTANTQKAVLINPSQIQNMQRNVNVINPQQISTIANQAIKIQKTQTTNQILGSNIKLVKQPQNIQQRVVLSQGQLSAINTQQIILPANFQGLKVISVSQPQASTSDTIFTTQQQLTEDINKKKTS